MPDRDLDIELTRSLQVKIEELNALLRTAHLQNLWIELEIFSLHVSTTEPRDFRCKKLKLVNVYRSITELLDA